jgi:Protein of unknown function (DUF3577)
MRWFSEKSEILDEISFYPPGSSYTPSGRDALPFFFLKWSFIMSTSTQIASTSSSATSAVSAKYFDLHVSGIGYLSRIRLVKPKKGGEFLSCSIAALHGSSDNVEYTHFDVRVSGALARKCIEALQNAVTSEAKVLIGFKVGDIYPDSYTVPNGTDTGQLRLLNKGRLLQVVHAKVNGVQFELPQSLTEDQTEAQAA